MCLKNCVNYDLMEPFIYPKEWSENNEGCAKCGKLHVTFINVTQKPSHLGIVCWKGPLLELFSQRNYIRNLDFVTLKTWLLLYTIHSLLTWTVDSSCLLESLLAVMNLVSLKSSL